MAGHSKWANIQHRKNRQDEKKGKIFGRLIKEITVAARLGGGDVESNPRLRLAIDRAREANMPKDKLTDAIKRGTGQMQGVNYEEIRYEGYGPGGVAFLVDCMTDNKTRTVSEVRHAFSKNGGNLGTDGSVSYLFKSCSQFFISSQIDEDEILEVVISSGADDLISLGNGNMEVLGQPDKFLSIRNGLEQAKITIAHSEVTFRAETQVEIANSQLNSVQQLVDSLESLEDVQNIYINASL
ncbi:MAG: YebC/PmpR family DNA-binding transcriptional regulator [Betaproteobacteria bacterium TMED82]|nr:MAG: YebC/PmpR family DNA-binding transcriptional regulator [Betaproteobacteria bacterium TMED82]|tara:strand:+ start:14884 stop:15603 length:720 start_codon:yes stop_codon:yes gene_type:complete